MKQKTQKSVKGLRRYLGWHHGLILHLKWILDLKISPTTTSGGTLHFDILQSAIIKKLKRILRPKIVAYSCHYYEYIRTRHSWTSKAAGRWCMQTIARCPVVFCPVAPIRSSADQNRTFLWTNCCISSSSIAHYQSSLLSRESAVWLLLVFILTRFIWDLMGSWMEECWVFKNNTIVQKRAVRVFLILKVLRPVSLYSEIITF